MSRRFEAFGRPEGSTNRSEVVSAHGGEQEERKEEANLVDAEVGNRHRLDREQQPDDVSDQG